MKRDAATEAQVRAARPDASTWLAANAGSGKTRVLTDRVARLLLDGVEPQNILCLTYTKAAASEMQNRLFRRLGQWTMLDDAGLAQELDVLGVEGALTPDRMRHARTLFARAIEAPGGLKIQTIHSFCSSLLRRFPLEAGVSPQFAEMEDRAAKLLVGQIVEAMADGPQRPLLDALAAHVSDARLEELLGAVLKHRLELSRPRDEAALCRLFGLEPGMDEATLLAEVFDRDDLRSIAALAQAMAAGSSTDQKNAAKLALVKTADLAALELLEGVFLTGAKAKEPFSAKIGSVPTKATAKAHAALVADIEPLMLRVEAARPLRAALAALRKAQALHAFAAAFLPEYERQKQLRGLLDFDDLILKARQLLNDRSVAAWVLYRLDGGIDHILVDEAQDTSPDQWDVVEKLAQEFTTGEGARADVRRTIFVVGDKKQSIYSFQGADPGAFDRMQAEFGRRLQATGETLFDLTLEYSFRSAEAILRLVDNVFAGKEQAGFPAGGRHRAFHSDLPGRVDLWPVIAKTDEEERPDWTDPVDRPGAQHHEVVLARQVAQAIRGMIDGNDTIPDRDKGGLFRRPVRPGDVLVLVQRRSTLFAEIIRACKAAGLPIAGADRLKVGAELAVKDLAALLRFLATPEDDLSLAAALRSPLFGWSEQQLFDLAHRRGPGRFLWNALYDRRAEFETTVAILTDLRGNADFLRPFDLIERILTRHGGRKALLGRLGSEAEDGINALLAQALAYESSSVPSLTGFLVWMETDDLEIKRQLGSAGDMIRVMTVHGSKGLEAPIVILPDTANRKIDPRGDLVEVDGMPLWRVPADAMPPAMAEARAALVEREAEERLRLLYVALTRAEKWLIVCAAGETGASWYDLVEAGMRASGAVEAEQPFGLGLSLVEDDWWDLPLREPERVERAKVALPEVFERPAAVPAALPETLSPSDLGGAKALPGADGDETEAAKLRGTRIHRLLEHLPTVDAAERGALAEVLLACATDDERAFALAEATAALDHPELSHLWGAEVLVEVPVTASIGNRRIHGVIDRLLIGEDSILAVDIKTNGTVPARAEDCPEAILRQMGAYAAALAQIWPRRRIETAVLWTRAASLMPLPHDLVTETLGRTQDLDLGASAT
ncbi:double-strand break repair helicase AddA [Seohaeicola zhoushanensis]|uniref:DNA 3'-5' helicase n=1 Tax=Seohaeicola zhoushanensis TaxID=1569283 RepID=A0A8J3GUG9_9RHOB|nr:double-strand break repair helicase AddA [Seohaeicola zhoushanensis]GHF35282.1 double-strand break repair helicase AddA [Seohaeicola zhoushanensis]